MTKISPTETAAELAKIVGEKYVLTGPQEMGAYLSEPRDLWHGLAACVVRPGSTEEVAAVLRAASRHGVPVTTQGGRTGVVGGADPGPDGIALSLERMNRILEIDPAAMTMTVEAGCVLQTAHEAAEAQGMILPLDLGARGTATIGGNIATNAGGLCCVKYGVTTDYVLGVQVVLADGTAVRLGGPRLKDVAGLSLTKLFVGSEGTLGVVT